MSVTKPKLNLQVHNHNNQTAQRKMPTYVFDNEYNVKTWKLLFSKQIAWMFKSANDWLKELHKICMWEKSQQTCPIPDNFSQIHVLAYQIKLPVIFAIGYFYMYTYFFFPFIAWRILFFNVDHWLKKYTPVYMYSG